MEWSEINSEQGIHDLLETFDWFHDGCLREIHLWNSYYVGNDYGMGAGDHSLNACVLFQRQCADPSAIELKFSDIQRMNIVSTPKTDWYMIFDCVFICKNNLYYWADNENWDCDNPDCEQTTWISAKRVMWRDRSEWMDEQLRYGAHD